MAYIAAIEVDKRQQIIVAADKMKEMLGGSWTIAETKKFADEILYANSDVTSIKISSGEIWLRAENLGPLEECLWLFREKIVNELGLPCSFAIEEEASSLQGSAKALQNSIYGVKHSKCGEAGHLSLPWFAPCQIQPSQTANHWIPGWEKHEQHKRRSLICESSLKRLKRGFETLEEYYFDKSKPKKPARFPIIDKKNLKTPQSLNDFASGEGSYLALLRFDADRSGDFFKWIDLTIGAPAPPWEPLKDCSAAFGACLDAALAIAFENTIELPSVKKKDKIPISPLIAEGEDFLIVLRKDLALPFTFHLLKAYSELTGKNDVLSDALKKAKELAKQNKSDELDNFVFTLSGAVVFARSGFPFSVLSELSGTLEHSAKDHRKHLLEAGAGAHPCLDVYWLESTAREDPLEARHSSLTYPSGELRYSLNTRPWTLVQTEAMWEAAKTLKVPRGKRHQLLAGLWSGEPLASFHYQRWMQHLSSPQLASVQKATDMLRAVGLWKDESEPWFKGKLLGKDCMFTPLLELHELCEMAGSGGDEGKEEEPA